MNDRTTFFTIVARNYLAQAYVLGDSVKKYHPEATFSIFLIDDAEKSYEREIKERGLCVIYPEAIAIANYKHFVFKYNIVEACTGVKPFVIQHLIDEGANKVIYIDPDTLCFRRFDEVLQELDIYSIVITPHSVSPLSDDYFPSDSSFLMHGVYNLGFIGVARGVVTSEFLVWWMNHLYKSCLNAPDLNLFVDQKWIDLAPCYFDRVKILRSLAYNIAYWNIHERTLIKKNGTFYVEQSGEPVAFIHYSGVRINSQDQTPESISWAFSNKNPDKNKKTYSLSERPDLVELFQYYGKLLIENNYHYYFSIPYAFSKYSNGEEVSQLERYLFLTSTKWQKKSTDPFQVNEDSFCNFCRNLGIKSKTSSYTTYSGFDLKPNSKAVIKQVIRFAIKVMIRVMGVDSYTLFATYLTAQLRLVNHDFLLEEKE